MQKILVLIAGAPAALDDNMIDDIAAALRGSGAEVGAPVWLALGRACDLGFGGIDDGAARRVALAAIGDSAIDCAVVAVENRRKKLLVADMDSTIVTGETIDELADFAGVKPRVAEITERAMRGEIAYAEALRERAGLLAGLDEDALESTRKRLQISPGATVLVRTMRANGAYAALVSGGFRFFTRRIAAEIGFDRDEANDLILAEGRLTGAVREPILDRDSKRQILMRIAAARGLTPADALAVGDGDNDLPMIETAGMGVAYHAKPKLAAAADCRVDHNDLTALLFLQGYREEEFVS